MKTLQEKILHWLATGETGTSSKTIAFVMVGEQPQRNFMNHPSDPDDFKRCLKLLREIPEIRPRLDEMRCISPKWNALIDHWQEVEDCFMAEVPDWLDNVLSEKSASKVYELMDKIYVETKYLPWEK